MAMLGGEVVGGLGGRGRGERSGGGVVGVCWGHAGRDNGGGEVVVVRVWIVGLLKSLSVRMR